VADSNVLSFSLAAFHISSATFRIGNVVAGFSPRFGLRHGVPRRSQNAG